MKRWMLIGLLLLTAMLLAGCVAGGSETQQPEEKKLILVGFSQVGSESNWRVANTDSMKKAFSEENGYELIFDNAKQKQENQIKAIRTFIQQEVDYIILAPITETGWESVLEEARAENIPVLIVDRQVNVADQDLYTAWVGSDFRQEARVATKWLEQELQRTGRQDDPIRILHLQGTISATAQLRRSAGLEEAAAAHDNWSIVAQLPGEYTQAKAYEVVMEYLMKDRDIDVLYCENDDMAFGAMEAMDRLGIAYGADGGVIVISFDAVHAALQACLDGKINLCVECNPLHGPRVASLIEQMEAGEQPPKKVYVEETSFSTDTLTEDVLQQRVY